MVSISSEYLFPTKKREAVTQGGTTKIDHQMGRTTQEASNFKGWEAKMDHERIQDILMYKNDMIVDPLDHQQMNLNSPHLIYIYIYIII